MLTWIKKFAAPPIFEGDEGKTRTASLLNTVLLTVLVLVVMFSLFSLALSRTFSTMILLIVEGVMLLVVLGSRLLMRRGHVQLASMLFSLMLWGVITFTAVTSGGVRTSGFGLYLVVIIIAGLLLGGRAGFGFAGLSALAGLAMLYAQVSGILREPAEANAPAAVWGVFTASFVVGAATLNLATRNISAALVRTQHYAAELEAQRGQLENLVQKRTRDLMRHTSYLGTATAIAQEAASVVSDPQQLLSHVVDLISEQFGFYHTGVFLLDASGEWVELRTASSAGGRQMLARGHRLRVGEEGIVGYVAAHGQYRVALDVGQDAVFFNNPDLPDTHSEVALPLRAQNKVIGVLDVQSTEPGAFSREDVDALQAVADQLATTINSVRLFQQVQESVEAERRAYGELTRQAWTEMLRARPGLGYRYEKGGVALSIEHSVSHGEQSDEGNEQRSEPVETLSELALPIQVRGHTIGTVNAHKPGDTGGWTPEEVALMETLVAQLSTALESARLYQDTQRRAAHERVLREVTARVRGSTDPETVLHSLLRQVGAVLNRPTFVRLVSQESFPEKDDPASVGMA